MLSGVNLKSENDPEDHPGYQKADIFDIPGQGPEGHLVLKLENEVGPPLQIQRTTLILTKIGVFDKKVLLFIYVQSDSSRSTQNSSGPLTNQGIDLAQV